MYRVEDLLVPGAAAEIAGKRLADLVVRGVRIATEQLGSCDDEARGAEAALDCPGLGECLLQRMQRTLLREALDRDDLVPVRLSCEDEARAEEGSVEDDGARSAFALLARVLRAGEAEPVAKRSEQALARPHVRLQPFPVDRDLDPHARHLSSARRVRTRSACRRYAAVPRTSSIGDAVDATSSASASASPSGATTSPGTGPAEPNDARSSPRAKCTTSASDTTAMTIAFRGPTFMNVWGCSPAGTSTATMSSSGSSAFRLGPRKNSCTDRRR